MRATRSTAASLSRDFYFKVFHKIHLNAAWFGGRDLDRFAKYQFGMFDDTRIHGVPASGVRFGELGTAARLVFVQHLRPVPAGSVSRAGVGPRRALDAELAADHRASAWRSISARPWNTMLRADVGKSFLPERYRGVGSATLQIMVLKPLR